MFIMYDELKKKLDVLEFEIDFRYREYGDDFYVVSHPRYEGGKHSCHYLIVNKDG